MLSFIEPAQNVSNKIDFMPCTKNWANIILIRSRFHLSNLTVALHEVQTKESLISKEYFFKK
jgi:hypothetical protein